MLSASASLVLTFFLTSYKVLGDQDIAEGIPCRDLVLLIQEVDKISESLGVAG